MAVDPGYTADGVLIATVELPDGAPDARVDGLIDGALDRLRATPGVVAAGAGAMIPLMRLTAMASFTVPASAAGGKPTAGVPSSTGSRQVCRGARPAPASGPVLRGRDRRAGTMRTIVNEEFVRQHLASPEAAGLMLPGLVQAEGKPTAEMIGVVGDVLKDGHDRQPQPALYFVHGPTARASRSACTW